MKKLFGFFIFLVVLVGIGFIWWKSELAAVNRADTQRQKFIVSSGEGTISIAKHLQSAGLIRNEWAFFVLVKELGLSGKLQAGEFSLSRSMNAKEIAGQLKTGTFDIWVSVPEGKRAEEIGDILQKDLPTFQNSWRQTLDANEGYLFPSTYRFPRDASLDLVVSTMRKQFDEHYASMGAGEHGSFSKADLVIIASLVEREAKYPEDRPLVASVIFNRLEADMLLNIDATVQYALGNQGQTQTWWKSNLTAQDLAYPSLYNTYLHQGLPPGPISNPGADVLSAVIHAPKTAYIYYVSDASGHNHYAKTLDEHNANIRKYGLE